MALRWSTAACGLLVLTTSLGAGPAQGSGPPARTGRPPLAEVAVAAPAAPETALEAPTLARITYPWQARLAGWEIVFLPAQPELRGLTLPGAKRIEIYVRPTDTADSLARVVAHELGHAVDLTHNDALDRARWRTARGVGSAVAWWPDDATDDFATVSGDFAEAFAVWQTGVVSRSTVAGQPTADQLALLASLVS